MKIQSEIINKQNIQPPNQINHSDKLDEKSQIELKNIKFNEDSLTKLNKTQDICSIKSAKRLKNNSKAIDFIDYAQKNGINVKLEYEGNNSQIREHKKKENFNKKLHPSNKKNIPKDINYNSYNNFYNNNRNKNKFNSQIMNNKFNSINSASSMPIIFEENFFIFKGNNFINKVLIQRLIFIIMI